MKHYKDPATNTLYAYEADGSQDNLIKPGLIAITDAEADAIRAAMVQPNPVPQEVSRFQAKAALSLAGKLAQADAAVAASNDPILQLAWAEATTFKRNSPGIAALAPAIGLDDAALDALFTTAAGIVA